MKNHPIIFACLFLVLFFSPVRTVSAQNLTGNDIVVSIKPLHSLVTNITGPNQTPYLLLSAPASPHDYTLKPSNAQTLANAKIVFWMGPQVELFLVKPIKSLAANAATVSFPAAEKNTNPHTWLDPRLAQKMVEKIAATLIAADPDNAALYQKNLATTLTRLDELDSLLAKELTNIGPIFVFHNAYTDLARRYNFKITGVLANHPEIAPGAKHIRKIRQQLLQSKAVCIFSEPQFSNKILTTVTQGIHIKTAILDPLGSEIPPGPNHYFTMMKKLADSLANCR